MGTLNFLGSVGYLKNNPCNIRYSENVIWEGEDGSVLGYSIFKNMMYGYKAAIELVNIYIKKGYSTLEDITSRWSSVFENDRKAYVSRFCNLWNSTLGQISKQQVTPDTDMSSSELNLCDFVFLLSVIEMGVPSFQILTNEDGRLHLKFYDGDDYYNKILNSLYESAFRALKRVQ